MKFETLLIIMSFQFIFIGSLFPQKFPDNVIHEQLMRGIDLLGQENYYEANKVFSDLDSKFPDVPFGKIYIASCEIIKSFDYGIDFNRPVIEKCLKEAEEKSKELLDYDDENLWNNYFLALTLSTKAYYNSLDDSWFGGLTSGLEAVKYFKKCTEINRSFTDATNAIAIFEYWKSRKTEALNWLPGFGDKTEEAIKILEANSNAFSYIKYNAINSLIWIYNDKKDFQKAIGLAQIALQRYPNSRMFKWGLARAYEEIDKNKSIEIYYSILTTLSIQKLTSNFNTIVVKHKIAQDLQALGKKQESAKICDEILSINDLNAYEKTKLKDRLERVRQLRKQLN